MDYDVAGAMASQPSQISMSHANFRDLSHWNENLLAGSGFEFPLSATSTSSYSITQTFGGAMPSSTQPSGSDLIDSDEDFGDFESVPAEGNSANAFTNVGLSSEQVTKCTSQPQGSYDIFDFPQVSANADSGSTHVSASTDLFARLDAPSKDPSIEGAPGPVSVNMSEINSDDDWGDFVEHSTSANQENLQSFDWFHAAPLSVGVTLPETVTPGTNSSNSRTIYEQFSNSNANLIAEVLPGVFDHFTGFSNVTEAAGNNVGSEIEKPQDRQVLEAESAEFGVNGFGDFAGPENFIAEGNTVSSCKLSEKSDGQDLNHLTATLKVQPHEFGLQIVSSGQIMSHARKDSVIGNISSPIPLSLFGEEELENEVSKEDLVDTNTMPSQGYSSSNSVRKTSLPSCTENFSDFIASLYAQSQAESAATDAHAWKEGSLNTKHVVRFNEGCTIFGNGMDERGPLHDESINILQSSNRSESGSLEEQLFDLKLNLRRQRNCKNDHGVADGTVYESCESITSPKENSLHSDVGVHQSDSETSGESQKGQFNIDTDPLHKLDHSILVMLLTEQRRIHEALAGSARASALDDLSSLQEAYNVALKASEQDKVTCIKKKIEEAKSKLASVEGIWLWQKQSNHMVSESLATASVSNGVDTDGAFAVKTATFETSLHHTMEEMLQKLGKSFLDRRAVVFEAEFQSDKLLSLAKSDVAAAVELHSQAVATFWVLACASVEDQHSFVRAWAAVLMVCASELEHALNVWKQAQQADVHLALLADVQGERYFAAIGQIYAVSQVLAAASTLYRPWLSVAVNEGKNIHASLQHCKAAWVGTGLKEAVRLALCGLGNSLPNEVLCWHDIEGFATIAHGAAVQAANFDVTPKASRHLCGFCLLPFLSFNCLPSVEWAGCHYLLPLANIWANCVSHEAPKLPLIELGNIVIP